MLCPGASSAQQRCSSAQPSDAVVRRVICASASGLSVLSCRCGCPAAWLHGPLWLVRHASCTRFSGAAAALQQQQQRSAAICRVTAAADPVFSLCMRSLCSLAAYFYGPTAEVRRISAGRPAAATAGCSSDSAGARTSGEPETRLLASSRSLRIHFGHWQRSSMVRHD